MADGSKDRTKFCNVDILEFMGKVVERHTEHYQSDFQIDKEILHKAADRQKQEERTFIWLCRTYGTWCLLERDVFLKDTRENTTFCFYAEQTSEPILAFVIEVMNAAEGSLFGDVYVLDYAEHYSHVRSVSLNAESVVIQYEHGCRTRKADEKIDGYPDIEYGALQSVQYQPRRQEELEALLRKERQGRVYCREGSANAYISRLS